MFWGCVVGLIGVLCFNCVAGVVCRDVVVFWLLVVIAIISIALCFCAVVLCCEFNSGFDL